ncbi:protein ltv1 [Acrodontium crateriforme]|uniref:Protein ltv1 n=1 Tax=Acrodontium crateriforme TaxID=150365 RepID=A0AAQ3M1I5_9PEZI|nr:protein ltv1 [Acrodontium crateriforme]
MPPRRIFDKKTATTFSLVHRAQNDPLINDENAPSMVFTEKQSKRPTQDDDDFVGSSARSVASGVSYRSTRTKQLGDLDKEFGLAYKPHEGEAAQHGVFFDDTQYNYMQHMRDLGQGGGAMWVEGSAPVGKKGKMKLEDALRNMDLGPSDAQSVGMSSVASSARSLLPEEVLPSEFVRKRTYQDQQDIPDEIAGFQPDMDPRLREVLEALEDEEYVDEEEDIFGELTKDGYEVEREEWDRLGEQQMFEDEDDAGWESDDTIKAGSTNKKIVVPTLDGEAAVPPEDVQAPAPADPTEGAWMDEFKKFKSDNKATKADRGPVPVAAPSTLQSSALSSLASGRRKKRKGAKTSTSNYSMSSSALVRTDQQTLLDARFDKIEESYLEDEMGDEFDDEMSLASGMTGMSRASKVSHYSRVSGLSGISGISSYSRATDSEAPQLQRSDFNGIMDEFLGSYSTTGKVSRRVKRQPPMTGMEQLNEIRSGLGPARLKSTAKTST